MFVEVLSLTYHSPITIESLTYRALRGTLWYSSSRVRYRQDGVGSADPFNIVYKARGSVDTRMLLEELCKRGATTIAASN